MGVTKVLYLGVAKLLYCVAKLLYLHVGVAKLLYLHVGVAKLLYLHVGLAKLLYLHVGVAYEHPSSPPP